MWSSLAEYQQNRILVFLNPEVDPRGAGYQIIQSKVAVGSGGFWGQGFTLGPQKRYDFLPEQHTDFIFSVIGEELGFRGLVHRFFRDAACRLPGPVAACTAALASATVFTICHPYGWIGLPQILLFGLATAFLREWRGSLIAPVALHSGFNAYLLLWDAIEGRY